MCSFDVDPLGNRSQSGRRRMSSRTMVVNCFIAMGVARKACLTVWLVSSSAEQGRMPCRSPDNPRISDRTHLFGVKMKTLWSSVGPSAASASCPAPLAETHQLWSVSIWRRSNVPMLWPPLWRRVARELQHDSRATQKTRSTVHSPPPPLLYSRPLCYSSPVSPAFAAPALLHLWPKPAAPAVASTISVCALSLKLAVCSRLRAAGYSPAQ